LGWYETNNNPRRSERREDLMATLTKASNPSSVLFSVASSEQGVARSAKSKQAGEAGTKSKKHKDRLMQQSPMRGTKAKQ
jgi:hypothetical protein